MKMLLATAALATVVAIGSPALAQSTQEQSARAARDAYAQAQPRVRTVRRTAPRAAFAAVPGPDGQVHSTSPIHDVFDPGGTYLGSDPDPIIRNSLHFGNDGGY